MTKTMHRTAIWQSISTNLKAAISNGDYAAGDKLPTEAALARRFGVNRHTVRRAIADLAGAGLVHSRRGSGVFVLAKPLDYPISNRVRFHQNLMAAGRLPEREVLSVEIRAASESDARRLALHPGDPIAVSHTLSCADGVPVALAEAQFPEARIPGLAKALQTETSITKALKSSGVDDYTRRSTRLTATAADAVQALHLRVREGAPLLLTEAISVGPDGMPVEYGRTWFASERITLTLEGDGPLN